MFDQRGVNNVVSVHWFRHGLRLHDNPAFLEAIKNAVKFFPIFIFDGESAGTKHIGYNRMKFLLESLDDLDNQLRKHGGRLYIFRGNPRHIFQRLWEELCLNKICFEQDCEPIWEKRDEDIKAFCKERGIEWCEEVSHTLWDPHKVVNINGGVPPLTYQMFLHTVSVIGPPPRPVEDIDMSKVNFGKLPDYLAQELQIFDSVPKPEIFGLMPEPGERMIRWIGGETQALKNFLNRLKIEEEAFLQGFYLTNQVRPDILAPPTSQSAALRYGCLSIRRFYWAIHDLFEQVHKGQIPVTQSITGQLIWREYFYTMSVNNPQYAEMASNPICLNINWMSRDDPSYKIKLERWKCGKTGFPFIDAGMRQLKLEGWIHHVVRNAVACFLTRGDLWISWEDGLNYFLKYLIDADWSVCAGNWMWVSSSAFEQLLDCSLCICPVNFGRRLDPYGEYIRRYVPEIRNLPIEYIYEPWVAPLEVQKAAKCVIGEDYPERIVDHKVVSHINRKKMEEIRDNLVSSIPHCCPSNKEEVRKFMWLQDHVDEHMYSV